MVVRRIWSREFESNPRPNKVSVYDFPLRYHCAFGCGRRVTSKASVCLSCAASEPPEPEDAA